jgi:ankyrin repeat protein
MRLDPFALLRAGNLPALVAALAADPALAACRNADGASLVAFAAYMGNTDAAAAIRAALPALDAHEAIILGDTARLEKLLAEGFDANARSPDGFTPLALAAFFRNEPAFDRLLALTADLDARAENAQQVAAIHAAVAARSPRMVEKLLRAGADPNLAQQAGTRPIHAGALHGDAAITGLLLLFGADPKVRDAQGRAAADFAREAGHDWLAERL